MNLAVVDKLFLRGTVKIPKQLLAGHMILLILSHDTDLLYNITSHTNDSESQTGPSAWKQLMKNVTTQMAGTAPMEEMN